MTVLRDKWKICRRCDGQRDLEARIKLRSQQDETYKAKEEYWSRKSRVKWSQIGDKNTKYFHAVIGQRRRMNIKLIDWKIKRGNIVKGNKQ